MTHIKNILAGVTSVHAAILRSTDDALLSELGLTDDGAGAAEAPAVAEDREAELNAMTVKDLKQYASEKGIALDSKAKKAEIIETILQAESK